MKIKIIAVLLAVLVLLVGCKTAEPKAEETAAPAATEAPKPTAEPKPTQEPAAEPTPEPEPVKELIGKDLPEISGTIRDLKIQVIGLEEAIYFRKNPAIRVWLNVENNGKYMTDPRILEDVNIIGYQNGEELDNVIGDDASMCEYYWLSDFYPGTFARCSMTFKLKEEGAPLSIWFNWDEGEATYDFDLSDLSGAPEGEFTLAPVTDLSWFAPVHETTSVFDVEYSVEGFEIVPGYAHHDSMLPGDILRITFKAVSTNEKDTYIGTPFTPVQDGMELLVGSAKEKSPTKLNGAVTIHPGETVYYTYDYSLHNTTSPVMLVRNVGFKPDGVVLDITK